MVVYYYLAQTGPKLWRRLCGTVKPPGQFVYVFFMLYYTQFIRSMQYLLGENKSESSLPLPGKQTSTQTTSPARASQESAVCFPCGIRGQLLNPQVNFACRREIKKKRQINIFTEAGVSWEKKKYVRPLSPFPLPDVECLGRFLLFTFFFPFPFYFSEKSLVCRTDRHACLFFPCLLQIPTFPPCWKDPCVLGPTRPEKRGREEGEKRKRGREGKISTSRHLHQNKNK